MPFALAVNVADWTLLTGAVVTLNPAVVAPALTVTDPGIATAGLSTLRETTIGFGAAELRYTEHAFGCEAVNDGLPQETDERLGDVVGDGYN
jgi:hypothetical protein